VIIAHIFVKNDVKLKDVYVITMRAEWHFMNKKTIKINFIYLNFVEIFALKKKRKRKIWM
jgi:acyl-ACP thioesterase